MIIEITYSDEKWKNARDLNIKMARKYGEVDDARPWTVSEVLKTIDYEDYVIYISMRE